MANENYPAAAAAAAAVAETKKHDFSENPATRKKIQTNDASRPTFEKILKSMIFEELRIFGRRRQIRDDKLRHMDLFSSMYDPKWSHDVHHTLTTAVGQPSGCGMGFVSQL